MGCVRVLILAGSILFVVVFAIGVGFVDGVAGTLEPLLCGQGERVEVEHGVSSDGGNTANVYCVGEQGKQISWRSWAWTCVPIPLALVLFFLFGGRGTRTPTVTFGSVTLNDMLGSAPVMMGMAGGKKKTLADRLRELDEAYQAGLITKDEFDRTRQQILDSQVDE